tara:strand:+ start:1936 stop:2283 length:348 start_codon:yes stop_codon:yes gene_type:complete
MKPLTLHEYIDAGEDFFPKYYYVAGELGEGAKAEDILKIMESLAGVAMKKRDENTVGPWGFLKENLDDNVEKKEVPVTDTATGIFEYPEVADPRECEKWKQVGVKENGVWKCYDI